jgi:hypothetical protein
VSVKKMIFHHDGNGLRKFMRYAKSRRILYVMRVFYWVRRFARKLLSQIPEWHWDDRTCDLGSSVI